MKAYRPYNNLRGNTAVDFVAQITYNLIKMRLLKISRELY